MIAFPDLPDHTNKVRRIQSAMRGFFSAKHKVRIYHSGTNSTRPMSHKRGSVIDISDFDRILSIDRESQTAWVEPNVTMKALVKETLKQGLVPPVVMELRSITVGGAIQGGAGESSSFRFGAFHENCLAYEVMLGNGDVVHATPTENADLFRLLPCTYGTVGIITLVKIQLVPAKPYVRLKYERVSDYSTCIETLKAKTAEPINFVDGIMFDRKLGTIMTGVLSHDAPLPKSAFLAPWNEWFYLHAQKITQKYARYEELIPLADYFFRYNRGAFWMGKFGFSLLTLPFNRLTRFLFHPLFKTRMLYRFIHSTNASQRYLLQDCVLPDNQALPFLEFMERTKPVFPLWLLPLKSPRTVSETTYGFLPSPLSIDIGIWTEVKLPYDEFVALNRTIERKVSELKGCQVLYAHVYASQDEFWQTYRRDVYDTIRAFAHATDVFPDIYEKVAVKRELKPSFFLGILKALLPPYTPKLR